MKRHTSKWSGLLLLVTTMAIGCSDSVVDSTTDLSTVEAYKAAYVDEAALQDFTELPSLAEALYSDGDSTCSDSSRGPHGGPGHPGGRHDGPHDGDSVVGWHHRGERGFGPLGFHDYEYVAQQLGLSEEQDSLFKLYLAELRSCAQDAAEPYKAGRQAAFDQMKAAIDEIRAAVAAGTITDADARTAIDSVKAEYRAAIIPLNEQVRAAVTVCRATFETNFEAVLTPEQLQLWLSLKG